MFDALPTLNAALNASSALLLFIGHRMIRRGDRERHRACMIGAFVLSALFLVSYLTYHYHHGTTRFGGEGIVRVVYMVILTSHTILATLLVPLAVTTMRRGLKGSFVRHAAIARWTYPVWLYVSITGVVVYILLYHVYPPAGPA